MAVKRNGPDAVASARAENILTFNPLTKRNERNENTDSPLA